MRAHWTLTIRSAIEIAQQELDKQNAQLNVLGATISSGRNAWFQEQNDLNTQVESQVQEGESLSDYPELLARHKP